MLSGVLGKYYGEKKRCKTYGWQDKFPNLYLIDLKYTK